MPDQPRPTDAGTSNEWTFVGGKAFVIKGGLPAVLGREAYPSESLIILTSGQYQLILTAHQARAVMDILPAAIALADPPEPT